MLAKRLEFMHYLNIPGTPPNKDIYINTEVQLTQHGVVIPVADDLEALIPYAAVKYLLRAKTPKEKESK